VRARNDEETTIGRREATNNLLQRGVSLSFCKNLLLNDDYYLVNNEGGKHFRQIRASGNG